jgi:hypothetical protein
MFQAIGRAKEMPFEQLLKRQLRYVGNLLG